MKEQVNKVKNYNQFVNEGENNTTLDIWKKLMDKYDLIYYNQYLSISNSDLEQMRENWKSMRRYALYKLNKELNDFGKNGQILNIDVSDEELYPYIDDKDKSLFFKYSRILDFSDGYKPKDIIMIKKGL